MRTNLDCVTPVVTKDNSFVVFFRRTAPLSRQIKGTLIVIRTFLTGVPYSCWMHVNEWLLIGDSTECYRVFSLTKKIKYIFPRNIFAFVVHVQFKISDYTFCLILNVIIILFLFARAFLFRNRFTSLKVTVHLLTRGKSPYQ